MPKRPDGVGSPKRMRHSRAGASWGKRAEAGLAAASVAVIWKAASVPEDWPGTVAE